MKIILLCLAIMAIAVATTYIWGLLLPVSHETKISKTYSVAPDTLFSRISNFKEYPQWRTGVKNVEMDGNQRFIEESGHGKIPYKVKISESPSHLITEIDDPRLPFSGTWTFEISPQARGALLTITERGKVSNPLFRFMSKYIFSHEKTIQTYLNDLDKAATQNL